MKPNGVSTFPEGNEVTDILTPDQRQFVMSRIRGKDTKPEMLLRRGLHGRGLRYRLHVAGMAGKPDIVFHRHRTAVFVNGCFWHGHGCSLFRWPKTRTGFWRAKINRTIQRDREVRHALRVDEWRVLVVWECAVRGKHRRTISDVLNRTEAFIRQSREPFAEIMRRESTSQQNT